MHGINSLGSGDGRRLVFTSKVLTSILLKDLEMQKLPYTVKFINQ